MVVVYYQRYTLPCQVREEGDVQIDLLLFSVTFLIKPFFEIYNHGCVQILLFGKRHKDVHLADAQALA